LVVIGLCCGNSIDGVCGLELKEIVILVGVITECSFLSRVYVSKIVDEVFGRV